MEHITHTIKQHSQEVALSREDQAKIRSAVVSHMVAHPIQGVRSPFTLRSMRTKRVIFGAVILSMFVGSSVSFAAEQSLPGGVLYPVKIYVNEPVRGAFALGAERRALLAVELADRRLNEMERLGESASSDIVRERAVQNFERSAARVRDGIESLEREGKTESAQVLARKFSEKVRAREEYLATRIEHIEAETPPSVNKIIHAKNLERMRAVRERMEARTSNPTQR